MYGLPPPTQRPASTLYPSIQSGVPSGPVGENYYSNDPYARPQSQYGGGYQSAPQQPYPQYDQRAPTQPPSYAQPHEQYPPSQQPSNPYPNLSQRPQQTASPQLQRQVSNQQYPPQQNSYPPHAPQSAVSDADSASFYYGDKNAPQPSQPPMQRTQSFNSQQQQPPPQQTPISPPAQPAGAWQNPPYPRQDQAPNWQQSQTSAPQQHQAPPPQSQPQQQQQTPPPQQQQQYWQQQTHSPQQHPSSQAWQPAPYATGGYGPESFPSAPQNQLPQQQKIVDEPLIDL